MSGVVAIAGATGFVGQALRRALVAQGYQVIGLTRSPTRAGLADESGVEWRHCDLFSATEVKEALSGVDYAVYLVHSMLPSARLTQASFVDLDLLLADNFARAAEANSVQQILYVGGIRPRDSNVSDHLASRLEVEDTLSARSVPMTAVRAGIILGPGGSSMRMLVNLVRRLPMMVLPAWTRSMSAPIAIDDVVRALLHCLGNPEVYGECFEVGGPEEMSYREMMRRTADVLGRKVPMVNVPVFSPGLSKRWVMLVSGTPWALVAPLVDSLRHSVTPRDNELQRWLVKDAVGFDEALRRSVDAEGAPLANPRRILRVADDARLREARTVRSVQRLPLPPGIDADWVANEYMRWLPKFVWPFLTVEVTDGCVVAFKVRLVGWTLLQLTKMPDHSTEDRQMFFITGGILARTDGQLQGRFEFREALGRGAIIAAIHDFRPTLPWYLYNATQAIVHLIVMRGFGRHLGRVEEGMRKPELAAKTE